MNARGSCSGYRASRPSVTAIDLLRIWMQNAVFGAVSPILLSRPPSSLPPRLRRRLPFVYPSGAFNGRENTALSTGCWRTRPSPKGDTVVSNNFCSPPLSSLLVQLLFHETHSFLRPAALQEGAEAAVTAPLAAGGPSFRTTGSPAAMDFSPGAHFIKNRST